MDIKAEARRMIKDDGLAWEMVDRLEQAQVARKIEEAEQLRLVFCEYVRIWGRYKGRQIDNEDDYHLNMTAHQCCAPWAPDPEDEPP